MTRLTERSPEYRSQVQSAALTRLLTDERLACASPLVSAMVERAFRAGVEAQSDAIMPEFVQLREQISNLETELER